MPVGVVHQYIACAKLVGYPHTALVCGRCDNPGVICLDASEEQGCHEGQRIFRGPDNFVRMRADNNETAARNDETCGTILMLAQRSSERTTVDDA